MKYVSCAVTFAEVPDEVCLTIQLSQCPFRCHGCHSPYLRDDIGRDLNQGLPEILARYQGLVTCVCLMGDGPKHEYARLRDIVRTCHEHGLKVAHYSGYNNWQDYLANADINPLHNVDEEFDYVKLGPYVEELGPLTSQTTNQRFYKRTKDASHWEDITNKFWKRPYEENGGTK